MPDSIDTETERRIRWDKTLTGIERLKEKQFHEEPDKESKNGYYLERQIIGRDTPINGGIYVGGGEREAIIVDDRESDSQLDSVYHELLAIREKYEKVGVSFKRGSLSEVFQLVRKKIPYNIHKAGGVLSSLNLKPDDPVFLDAFISAGGGVCRHQSLLAAYLLERLAKDGYIGGSVSIDRNFIQGLGGHSWVRYSNSKGEVYIIDPARQYEGKLAKVPEVFRHFYERPQSS